MNVQAKLDQFRTDNPYDVDTQAKRMLTSHDDELILYTLALGLTMAKHRQRHVERDHMKNFGSAPTKERLVPGRVTGSVRILPTKKTRNAMTQLILDVWRVNGEQKLGDTTASDLAVAMKREKQSSDGHLKNLEFYGNLKKPLADDDAVRDYWDEKTVRKEIEKVYGEFRNSEAA